MATALMMLLPAMTRDAVRRLALVLQHGVERHGEQAAAHGDADEVGEQRASCPASATNAATPASAGRRRARPLLARQRSMAATPMITPPSGTWRPLTSPCSRRSARIEPRPTPSAKSASISVTTWPSAKRTSLAKTGRPATIVAPNSQNQEIASTGSEQLRRRDDVLHDRDRVGEQARPRRVGADGAGGAGGISAGASQPSSGARRRRCRRRRARRWRSARRCRR